MRGASYTFDPDLPTWAVRPLIRYTAAVQHCSLFVRSAFLRDNELYFDPTYRMRGDWDWLIRLFAATKQVEPIPDRLAYWRAHPEQTSKAQFEQGILESRRLCASHRINYRLHRMWALAGNIYAQSVHSLCILRNEGIAVLAQKGLGVVRGSVCNDTGDSRH